MGIEALVNCLSNNITTYHGKLFREKNVKFVPKDLPPNILKAKAPIIKSDINRIKYANVQNGLVPVSETELKTVMDNLKKKGINSFDMNQSKKPKVIIQNRSLLNQGLQQKRALTQLYRADKQINKTNPPKKIIVASPALKKNIIAMLQSNSTIMVPHKNVKEEQDSLNCQSRDSEGSLNCQSVSDNNVIALNIPMEDILGSSSDKADFNNEKTNTQIDALSIKKELEC